MNRTAGIAKLKGRANAVELRLWEPWLYEANKVAQEFADFGDDPFGYNETASVSALAVAAARTGYLCLAEYSSTKRFKHDLRKNVRGRCDFWMDAGDRSWSFEFKQTFPWRTPRSKLHTWLDKAVECAEHVHAREADRKVGCLIVSLRDMPRKTRSTALDASIDFADESDFAWRLRVAENDTFFFFKFPS